MGWGAFYCDISELTEYFSYVADNLRWLLLKLILVMQKCKLESAEGRLWAYTYNKFALFKAIKIKDLLSDRFTKSKVYTPFKTTTKKLLLSFHPFNLRFPLCCLRLLLYIPGTVRTVKRLHTYFVGDRCDAWHQLFKTASILDRVVFGFYLFVFPFMLYGTKCVQNRLSGCPVQDRKLLTQHFRKLIFVKLLHIM